MLLISEGILSGEGGPGARPGAAAPTPRPCAPACGYRGRGMPTNAPRQRWPKSKLIAASLDPIESITGTPWFNLTALAAELCVTPNHLSIRFKEDMGVGVHEISAGPPDRDRQRGCWPTPSTRCTRCPRWVGFQDEKCFSRQFKKLVGSPQRIPQRAYLSPVRGGLCPGGAHHTVRPARFLPQWDAGVLFFGRRVCYTGLKVHKRELNGRETERQPIPAEKGLFTACFRCW